MRKMLNDVVDGVPYHRGQVKGYKVGGKTGTTLVSHPDGLRARLDHSPPSSALRPRRTPRSSCS